MLAGLESDGDVEAVAGDLALALEDHPGVLAVRDSDAALVGMTGQVSDRSRRGFGVGKHRMGSADDLDPLEIAVRA